MKDVIVAIQLPDDFRQRYDFFRRLRNTIFHTVDNSLRITAVDVIVLILEATDVLLDSFGWVTQRRQFLKTTPVSVAASDDIVVYSINRELSKVVDMLKPAELRRFFRFNKRQRRYVCPKCHMDWDSNYGDFDFNLAQLSPNTAHSTNVYCIACERNSTVVRRRCHEEGCPSNVIETEDGCRATTTFPVGRQLEIPDSADGQAILSDN